MAAQTPDVILGRVSSIVASRPFEYERALEPFSVDLEPNQRLHRAFYLTMVHDQTDGYLGYVQAEIERLRIHLAQKINRVPHETQHRLIVDIGSLVSAVCRDGSAADYNAELMAWEIPDPGPQDTYVIGIVEFTVDYDREL